MKKYFIYAFILFYSQSALAEDLCLDMSIPEFPTYSERYLRIKDFLTSTSFSGYVQGSDNSYGSAIYAKIINNHFIFARNTSKGNMFYEMDMSTYDGNHISGIVYFTRYHLKNNVAYAPTISTSTQFSVIDCPTDV